MHGNYTFCTDLLGEPVYYDVFGAPHFEINPWDITRRDSPRVSFLKTLRSVTCQGCGKLFIVQMEHPVYSNYSWKRGEDYGDPPVHGCIGDTMSTIDCRKMSRHEEIALRDRHVRLIIIKEEISNFLSLRYKGEDL